MMTLTNCFFGRMDTRKDRVKAECEQQKLHEVSESNFFENSSIELEYSNFRLHFGHSHRTLSLLSRSLCEKKKKEKERKRKEKKKPQKVDIWQLAAAMMIDPH